MPCSFGIIMSINAAGRWIDWIVFSIANFAVPFLELLLFVLFSDTYCVLGTNPADLLRSRKSLSQQFMRLSFGLHAHGCLLRAIA